MRKRDFLIRFVLTFAVALVVNVLVVYLWDLIREGQGMFDWYRSLTIAFFIAIFVTLAGRDNSYMNFRIQPRSRPAKVVRGRPRVVLEPPHLIVV